MQFFVTGTDTEIGKTTVTVGLVSAVVKAGFSCVGLKPVAAGQDIVDDTWINEDVLRLSQVCQPIIDSTSIRGARAPTVATPRDVRARGFLDDLLAKAKGEDPAKNEQTPPSDAAEKDAEKDASEETDETRVAEPSSSSTSSESSTFAAAAPPAPPAPKPAMPKMPDAASTVSALDALLPPDPEAARRAAEEAADDERAAELDAERAAKAKAKAKAAETTTTTRSVSDALQKREPKARH